MFIVIYVFFTLFYDIYLNYHFDRVDIFSSLVGQQAAQVLRWFGFNAVTADYNIEKSTHIIVGNIPCVRVIEGCNGLSVMILFVAFLFGFPGSWKHKIWFIPAGLLLIHLFNISRVAILCWTVYRFGETGYPIYKEMFTASIYVLVLAMWYLWVQKFSIITPMKK